MTVIAAIADDILHTLMPDILQDCPECQPLYIGDADTVQAHWAHTPPTLCLMDEPMLAATAPGFRETLFDDFQGSLVLFCVDEQAARAAYPGLSALSSLHVFTYPFRSGQVQDRVVKLLSSLSGGQNKAVRVGPYTFFADQAELRDTRDDRLIRLTEKERDILALLYAAAGQVIARDALLQDIWGYVKGLETHTLETHIYRLRQKIEDDPAQPCYVLTDEKGYRLAEEVADSIVP